MLEQIKSDITLIFLPTVEIKDYDVMIERENVFDQLVKKYLRIYDNIWKITTGQSDDNTSGCLLDYLYFKKCYKLIVIDLT